MNSSHIHAAPAALSFDLDGTLASAGWRKLRLWRAILAHPRELGAYGRVFEAMRDARHQDIPAAVAARVAAEIGADPDKVAAIFAEQIDGRWPALFAGAPVPPTMSALMREADVRGIPRVVVSDYPALDKLAGLGLDGWAAVIDCRALGALKPHPDGLFAAAAAVGVPARALVHIGDRWETDGLAAARAGCDFVHRDQLRSDCPWPFLSSP